MWHSNTRRLMDYWLSRRPAEGRAPLRAAIDPSGFAPLLPQVFVLGRQGAGDWRFRLAGGLLNDLYGGELRGADALALWRAPQRLQLSACLEAARRRAQAFVATARGSTSGGRWAEFEILFAPLTAAPGCIERSLGLYQPVTPLAYLGARPLVRIELLDIATAGADEALPSLRLAALGGRRIA